MIWYPNPETSEHTRLYQWMKQLGFESYESLYQASINDVNWFSEELEKALGIVWRKPYKTAADFTAGVKWPKWYSGGQINIYESVVTKWAEIEASRHITAIHWVGEKGEIRTYTFKELEEACRTCASGLQSKGIQKGDVIGVYLPMIPETVITILAAAKLGAIVVPTFSGYGAEAVATRLKASEAKILITADGFYRRGKTVHMQKEASKAAELSPSIQHVVVVPRLESKVEGEGFISWSSLQTPLHNEREPEVMKPDAPLLLLYTSGTTGNPKGTVHTHAGFPIKAAFDAAFSMDVKQGDRVCWVTDMGWMMGPFLVFGALVNGATMVMYEGSPDYPHVGRLWEVTREEKLTHLGISPTLIKGLMRHGDEAVPAVSFPNLKAIASTGEPWNPDPWKWLFYKIGKGQVPIINYAGGTEISGGILTNVLIKPISPVTFNASMLGMAANVYNEHGEEVDDEIGELVIEKPWVGMTNGFWNDPDRYEKTYWEKYSDVWTHGDWVKRDKDGYWTITGRSDDIINVAGKRLGPAEMESILVDHSDVVEAAVVGIPDEMKGEVPVAFVVVSKDDNNLVHSLMRRIVDHLGKALRPHSIYIVKDLPKTRNAKVMRRVLKAAFLRKSTGNLDSLENPETLKEIENLQ
ncbi:acetyl-CoA synthetase [Geomicrobium halophilum]|uniref:acetate--CoA ligase n=2 Tax=Geomicrobium halophilum TaxID=549000 RepID=A0A841PL18_9BACL|nr:acetyl-CoA synthetase [Geomicrobium halophilum]